MADALFVPADFDPPTTLVTERFRLEPLGPQHNASDLAAWTSSVDHIRAAPGYPDGSWPPHEGMTPERNLADLERHARHFTERRGFTFTVLEPGLRGQGGSTAPSGAQVIGCVYIYPPSEAEIGEIAREYDVGVQSWVRVDRAELDDPLADAVHEWLRADWPWRRIYRYGR